MAFINKDKSHLHEGGLNLSLGQKTYLKAWPKEAESSLIYIGYSMPEGRIYEPVLPKYILALFVWTLGLMKSNDVLIRLVSKHFYCDKFHSSKLIFYN